MSRNRRLSWNDPCPICVAWTCGNCGHIKHQVDGRRAQTCPRCASAEGTSVRVTHYHRDTHDLHVKRAMDAPHRRRVQDQHARDVMALVDWLSDPVQVHRIAMRVFLRTVIGSDANTEAANTSDVALRRIESIVRVWVRDHPGEDK